MTLNFKINFYRGEDENDYSKKKNSFALSSIDESNDLSDAEFMRDVLKGIALDLAVLRRTVKVNQN